MRRRAEQHPEASGGVPPLLSGRVGAEAQPKARITTACRSNVARSLFCTFENTASLLCSHTAYGRLCACDTESHEAQLMCYLAFHGKVCDPSLSRKQPSPFPLPTSIGTWPRPVSFKSGSHWITEKRKHLLYS